MAATTTPLLAALLKKSTLDDHDELLKASNAALKKSKNDIEAQHVKTVALLKLEQYDDAVKFVEECGTSLKEKAALEYAYALYKTGKLEDAVQISSRIKSRGGKHLEAQASYRLENTQRTADLYRDIRRQGNEAEDFDLRVNQGAIDAQGQWVGQIDSSTVRRPGREDLEAFETAYNAACGSIARGELSQAEMLLKRAKELCKHSEDLTDEQKTDEILPISVQQLYVLYCLGKTSEAEQLSKEITVDSISDLSTRSIASSNLLLSSSMTSNPFSIYKAFNGTPRVPQSDKLFSYQSTPFTSNQKVTALQAFKFDGLRSFNTKQQTAPTVSPEVLVSSVYNAAGRAQNDTNEAAIQKMLPELEKHPNDIGTIITLVQMYVLNENYTSAINLLESFFNRLDSSSSTTTSEPENLQDIRFNPGLASILVSLYRKQGRKTQIKSELAKAASYWRQKSKAPDSLLKAAGSALLETQDADDAKAAADIFEKLRKQRPEDKAAVAGYVASHATNEGGQTLVEADKLTPISELIRNVDVDALERAGIPQSSNALAIAQLTRSRKRAAAEGASSKPKRIRKSRLPKEYDPTKTPDPERWLPLKDRSTYRPPKGKKKGKKGAGGGTQGGAVNEDLDINAINRTASPAPGGGGGGGKKKKGKGKK